MADLGIFERALDVMVGDCKGRELAKRVLLTDVSMTAEFIRGQAMQAKRMGDHNVAALLNILASELLEGGAWVRVFEKVDAEMTVLINPSLPPASTSLLTVEEDSELRRAALALADAQAAEPTTQVVSFERLEALVQAAATLEQLKDGTFRELAEWQAEARKERANERRKRSE